APVTLQLAAQPSPWHQRHLASTMSAGWPVRPACLPAERPMQDIVWLYSHRGPALLRSSSRWRAATACAALDTLTLSFAGRQPVGGPASRSTAPAVFF